MPEVDAFIHSPWMIYAVAVVAGAAWIHGVMGMGFPLITIALIAIVTDLKIAVLLTVLPNIALNVYLVAKGGNWRESLGRHWRVAVYMPLGTVLGTQVLIALPAEPLKLLLAAMILAHLNLARLKGLEWGWLRRAQRTSEAGVGLFAGFLSGTVSVTIPPLVIYFMALGLAPTAMVQIMNLCFVFGKATQAATLAWSGEITRLTLAATVPLTALALAFLVAGVRRRSRAHAEQYYGWLNKTLLVMALILVAQVVRAWFF
jgi:uncharacterized membrane protein YfcA